MNENTVELVGFYGSDETHALSAWTSTAREITPDRKARIGALLRKLASEGHHTPFEKSTFHFLLRTDVATHIHLLKHRVGVSVNAESARYRELSDTYYLPADWPDDLRAELQESVESALATYHRLIDTLVARGVPRKRAKESARYVLPYAKQLTQDVTFNWRSLAHFLRLRNAPDAQVEVREVAQGMLRAVQDTGAFPLTLEAWGYSATP